jgi:prephenate dehydratase
MDVFFQGEPGSFSEQAARQYFGSRVKCEPVRSFRHVFTSVDRSLRSFGIVPIENSVFGSIHQTYDLLLEHKLHIVGEAKLRICLHLMALPGVRMKDIRTVYSQPQALGQCEDFLRSLKGVDVRAYHDTAASARMLTELRSPQAAAIASEEAAERHGLKILRKNVESDHPNFTRFLVLARNPLKRPELPKTSIVFAVRDTPGALFKALAVFALRDINLLKVESRPLIGKPWEYLFYLDVDGDATREPVKSALHHLREVCMFIRVLGSYSSAASNPIRRSTT